MATIHKHRGKHQVMIRRKGHASITKTFHRLSDAKEWARMMETQADRAELGPDRKVLKDIKLADLVRRYRDDVLPGNKGGSVEAIMLNAFLRHPICKKTLADIKAFVTAPGQGVNFKRNVWHGILTPMEAVSDFVVVDWAGEGANLDEYFFETPYIVANDYPSA